MRQSSRHFIYLELKSRVNKILIEDEAHHRGLCVAISLMSLNRLNESNECWDDLEGVRDFMGRNFKAYTYSDDPVVDEENYCKFKSFCSETLRLIQLEMRGVSSAEIRDKIKKQIKKRINAHMQHRLFKQKQPPKIGEASHVEDVLTSMVRAQYRFEEGVDHEAIQSFIEKASFEFIGQCLQSGSFELCEFIQAIQAYPNKADDLINCIMIDNLWSSLQIGATGINLLAQLVPSSKEKLIKRMKTSTLKEVIYSGRDVDAYCVLMSMSKRQKKKFIKRLNGSFHWVSVINSEEDIASVVKHFPPNKVLNCFIQSVLRNNVGSLSRTKGLKRIRVLLEQFPDLAKGAWYRLNAWALMRRHLPLVLLWVDMFPNHIDGFLNTMIEHNRFKLVFKNPAQLRLLGDRVLKNKSVINYIFTFHGDQRYIKSLADIEFILNGLPLEYKQSVVSKFGRRWLKRMVHRPKDLFVFSKLTGVPCSEWVPEDERERSDFFNTMVGDANSYQGLMELVPDCSLELTQLVMSERMMIKIAVSFSQISAIRDLLDEEDTKCFDRRLVESNIILNQLDTVDKMKCAYNDHPSLKGVLLGYARYFLRHRHWRRSDLQREGLFQKELRSNSPMRVLSLFARACQSPVSRRRKPHTPPSPPSPQKD